MTVVLLLSNMWQWSGGFAAYVSWATGETAPPMRVGASDDEWQVCMG
jgi:mannan endo-1,4-beta-mannosidase